MKHECDGNLPKAVHGAAITDCYEDDDGKFWVGNGEYSSQVMFCPYCGERAKTMPRIDEVETELTRMRREYPESAYVKANEGKPDLMAEKLRAILSSEPPTGDT
jgi:hypothetical protein